MIDWKKSFILPFLCTRETKLQIFQFKFLHRRVATNSFLHKIGLQTTDRCSFCEDESETIIHLFWECKFTKEFWSTTRIWIKQHLQLTTASNLTQLTCFGLVDNTSNLLLHHTLLIARRYIFSCKMKNTLPKYQNFARLVENVREIEKRYANKSNSFEIFDKKWKDYKTPPTR